MSPEGDKTNADRVDTSSQAGTALPVKDEQRLLALDVLRGFAILGILLVNIGIFSGAQGLASASQYALPVGPNEMLGLLISVFAEGKFLSSLSFLFGLGFFWQALRAERRGASAARLLLRRCLGLGLIGVVHAVLIWSGDILFSYALLGLVLIVFRTRSPRTLLTWAGASIGVPFVLVTVATIVIAFSGANAGTPNGGASAFVEGLQQSAKEAYNSGSYLEMVGQRLREIGVYAVGGLSIGPALFAMMLSGAAVARAGWLENLDAHAASIRRAALFGLTLGLPLNIAYAASLVAAPSASSAVGLAGLACFFLGAPLLAIGYMAFATLLVRRSPDSGIFYRASAVGRLALSNYLTQSVVMTAVFYGLSIYGRIGLIPAMSIALTLLALQVIASPLYLRRFSYGPLEWSWRRMTYGRAKTAER